VIKEDPAEAEDSPEKIEEVRIENFDLRDA